MSKKKKKYRKKPKWLERGLLLCPPMMLCLSKEEYRRGLKHINAVWKDSKPWVGKGHGATTRLFQHSGAYTHIVCLRIRKGDDREGLHSLVAHEAVHVWQHTCEVERIVPCKELEALGVQGITLFLLDELKRRTRKGSRPGTAGE